MMVCDPVVVEEKVYVADPAVRARDVFTVVPSTAIVKVPVGLVVLELEAEATFIVMASVPPEAGVLVAADSVVVVATGVEPTVNVRAPVEGA